MFDFYSFSKNIKSIESQSDFSLYLESCFIEIEDFFQNITNNEIENIKFDIEDLLYDLLDNKLVQTSNTQIINAFLILLAEKLIQSSLIGSITIISDYLVDESIKIRLDVAKKYLKVNDVSKDYFNRCDYILESLENLTKIDEYNLKAIKSFSYFIQSSFIQFKRIDNITLFSEFINLIIPKRESFKFLQDELLDELFIKITTININQAIEFIDELFNSLNPKKNLCLIDNSSLINIENSNYSSILYSLKNPTFDNIRTVAVDYINSIGNPTLLYDKLLRGEKIIDDDKLLYKYLYSFGIKHKLKLYSAFDEIINQFKNERFDIVDWGCGQAMGVMLLIDYAKEKNIFLDIENITLIEPSSLALSRGLLHIDILKQKEYQINPINIDLDCLDIHDFKIKSSNKMLHIFSNILDIESFSLDFNFFNKVAKTLNNDSTFICISPNRNDKSNNRIDLFYSYFDENFDTKLISSRNSDIGNATRYEKIFEVKLQKIETEIVIEQYKKEISSTSNQIEITKELYLYSNYVEPILNLKMVDDLIHKEPEYIIFKIRKLAEILTSKIYSKYESNEKTISFNDKIRYLSYENKSFNKSITNYMHTIRTIGNRGVHEEIVDLSKSKLDAHLMIMALINLLKEMKNQQLI